MRAAPCQADFLNGLSTARTRGVLSFVDPEELKVIPLLARRVYVRIKRGAAILNGLFEDVFTRFK